jgi:hydrogenase/urease accessory protein HupE
MPDRGHLLRRLAAAFALLIFFTGRAEAHLVTTGLGPVYDGIGHFSTSVDDIFPALALALFAGLRGPQPGRWAMFILPAAWLAGGLLGAFIPGLPTISIPLGAGILSATFLVCGLLVAADLRLPPAAVAALAAALGLIHGFFNGLAMIQDGAARSTATLQLLGITVALFILVALAAALVVALRIDWMRIAVRVAGSWIAAMGLLWLGWSLRGRG